ncbi:hypothetical protein [Comamonas thiooxydans]|uniref:hypothetical protein n=1 Tax=Comamonas thiooxydans TaxID=363952 RepID=UPI001184FF9B|nr:hypothetical protein [Comamonas thiooxydans]
MAKELAVFIPHDECGASNGGCFEEGRCLMRCQPRLPKADANAELAKALRLLGVFVVHQRQHGILEAGSALCSAVNEAECLIKQNTR